MTARQTGCRNRASRSLVDNWFTAALTLGVTAAGNLLSIN